METQFVEVLSSVRNDSSAERTLDKAARWTSYRVSRFLPSTAEQFRLMELGIKVGEPIHVLEKALFDDPIKICIKGARYAVRSEDARCIGIQSLA